MSRLPRSNSEHLHLVSKTEHDADEFAVKMIGFYPDVSPLIKPTQVPRGSVDGLQPILAYDSIEEDDADSTTGIEDESVWSFREGSVRASVFNLCSATLGAGALSLPYAIKQASLLPGLVLLMMGGAATLFSIHLLIRARTATDARSYEDLTVQVMGQRIGIIMEFCVIIFCFGCAIAYIIAVGDILELVPYVSELLSREGAMCGFFFLVMFPLSMVDKVNDLRFTSLIGVASVVYLVVAASYHSVGNLLAKGYRHSWGGAVIVSGDVKGMLLALPVMIFAYTCQTNVFAVFHDLNNPTTRRMRKVSYRSVMICFGVYMFMGLAGYLDFGPDTRANILQNYIPELKAKGQLSVNDYIMVLACLAVTVTVVMAFPLVIFPCRFTIGVLVFGTKEKMNWGLHFVVTVILCVSALIVSLFVPSISTVFALMGGTTSSFVCFVLPALITIKLVTTGRMETPPPIKMACVVGLAVGGTLLGIASTATTVMAMLRREAT